MTTHGTITYDWEHGHVCTCALRQEGSIDRPPIYDHTVQVDRAMEPTESGSYWYVCSRCGAGGWSGC